MFAVLTRQLNQGGAVYLFRETASISDSKFVSNTAVRGGGGAVSVIFSQVDLQRTAFNGNEADSSFVSRPRVTFLRSLGEPLGSLT